MRPVHAPVGPETGVQLTPFVENISCGLAFTDESATNFPFPYVTDCHAPAGAKCSLHVEPLPETATWAVFPRAIHLPPT